VRGQNRKMMLRWGVPGAGEKKGKSIRGSVRRTIARKKIQQGQKKETTRNFLLPKKEGGRVQLRGEAGRVEEDGRKR